MGPAHRRRDCGTFSEIRHTDAARTSGRRAGYILAFWIYIVKIMEGVVLMRNMKRILIIFFSVVFTVAILPWFAFPILNDIKANNLKQELQSAPLPQSTEIIEALSGCGNTGGTGDHTETWAGIIIKTELSEDEIYSFYGDNVQKVDLDKRKTFIMDLIGKEFTSLKSISEYDGYYIVERVGNAVSSFFDIRGC